MYPIVAGTALRRQEPPGQAATSDECYHRLHELIHRVLADGAHHHVVGDQPSPVIVIVVPGAELVVESPTWAADRGGQPLVLQSCNDAVPGRGGALTLREREVAGLVARGCTNRQIAQTLHISTRTAESHVEHILNKLGFTTRAQIAAWAAVTGAADLSESGAGAVRNVGHSVRNSAHHGATWLRSRSAAGHLELATGA